MKQKAINTIDYSVIILAAGKSSRMGMPKWSLKFDDKSTFIEHIISEYYSFGCKEILLVINETDYSPFVEKDYQLPENVKVVINKHPEWDRFYSLKIGVNELEKVQPVFIHNVDNPFVNNMVLSQLLKNSKEADIIIPENSGRGGHPILINEMIIRGIRNESHNNLHFKEFLSNYKKERIRVEDEKVLANINTEKDYNLFFQKLFIE
jgi:molybdenum cofactor cytidylyltransferase